METLDCPPIEGFTPTKAYTKLGVGYICLANPDGVQMELSEQGALEADRQPHIAALLHRMGEFIAEHDGYRDVVAVKAIEPGTIYKVASKEPDYHRAMNHSSVYQPDSAPEVIIKAYDLDRPAAVMQFRFGAFMHDRFRQASDTVYCPRQLAMFTAPTSGHRTTVMEYIPGTTLFHLGLGLRSQHGSQVMIDYSESISRHVTQAIKATLGKSSVRLANDLRNTNNIIIDDSLPVDPENITDRQYSIIDQPNTTTKSRVLYALRELALRQTHQHYRPAASPASS